MPTVNGKAMNLQQMLGKRNRVPAIQVTKIAATQAFLVKMVAAITFFSNILIYRAAALLVAEFANGLAIAKSGEMAVHTAFPCQVTAVNGATKLLGRKLTVGVARKIVDQGLLALGFVLFFLQREAIQSTKKPAAIPTASLVRSSLRMARGET